MKLLYACVCFLALASPVWAQPGCQPRIQTASSWVESNQGPLAGTDGVTFGPGYTFDYPGQASRVSLVSFSGHVVRFDFQGKPQVDGLFMYAREAGIIPYNPVALPFSAYYYKGGTGAWTVVREFGPNADAALGFQLTPGDQWWAAATNAYPQAIWVRWVLHVVVC